MENSNNVSNRIEATSAEALEIRVRDKLDEYKKETREDIKEIKQETKENMQKLMDENAKLAAKVHELEQALINHQTATAEGLNAATNANTATNNRVDNVEKTLHLHTKQLLEIQETIGKEAQKMAKDVADGKLKIVPDQRYKGEDKFIGVLLDGKFDNENIPKDKEGKKFPGYKEKVKNLSMMCVSVAMKNVIDGALAIHKIERTMNTLCPGDQRTLGETFAAAFKNTNIGITGLNPYVAIAEVSLRAVAAAGILGWKYYKLYKEKKGLKRYWNQETAEYKKEIISMLIDSTEEGFNKMYEEYCHCYNYNYNRNDVIVRQRGEVIPRIMKSPTIEYDKVFTEIFDGERGEYFTQSCGIGSAISYKMYLAKKARCTEVFKIEKHLKSDLTKEQREKIDWMFRIIRANDKKVEFASHVCSGDGVFFEGGAIGGIAVIALHNLVTLGLDGLEKLRGQYQWSSSKSRLEHILVGYIIGCSPDKFKEIIERNEALARLKAYVDSSGSEFAKYCYEECTKDRYIDVKLNCIEEFKEGFKLYCKIYNLCECNPENYLDYVYTISIPEVVESTNLVTEGLIRVTDGLANTAKDIAQTREVRQDENGNTIFTTMKVTLPNSTTQLTTIGSHFTDDLKVLMSHG